MRVCGMVVVVVVVGNGKKLLCAARENFLGFSPTYLTRSGKVSSSGRAYGGRFSVENLRKVAEFGPAEVSLRVERRSSGGKWLREAGNGGGKSQ